MRHYFTPSRVASTKIQKPGKQALVRTGGRGGVGKEPSHTVGTATPENSSVGPQRPELYGSAILVLSVTKMSKGNLTEQGPEALKGAPGTPLATRPARLGRTKGAFLPAPALALACSQGEATTSHSAVPPVGFHSKQPLRGPSFLYQGMLFSLVLWICLWFTSLLVPNCNSSAIPK